MVCEKDEKDEKEEKESMVMIMIMPYCHLMAIIYKTITKAV